MSFLKNWQTLVMGVLLVALAVTTGLWRSASSLAEARQGTITALEQRVSDDAMKLAARDALIGRQNDAVAALRDRAEQNRKAYQLAYARADERAKDHDKRAAQLLALQSETEDELGQCRAARDLILKETM